MKRFRVTYSAVLSDGTPFFDHEQSFVDSLKTERGARARIIKCTKFHARTLHPHHTCRVEIHDVTELSAAEFERQQIATLGRHAGRRLAVDHRKAFRVVDGTR